MRVISGFSYSILVGFTTGLYAWTLTYSIKESNDFEPNRETQIILAYVILHTFSLIGLVCLFTSMFNTKKALSEYSRRTRDTWDNIINSSMYGRCGGAPMLTLHICKHLMGWYFMIWYLPVLTLNTQSVVGLVTLIELCVTFLAIEPAIYIAEELPDYNDYPDNYLVGEHVRCFDTNRYFNICARGQIYWAVLLSVPLLIILGLNGLYIYGLSIIPRSEFTKSYVHFTIIQEILWAIILGLIISMFNKKSPRVLTFSWWASLALPYFEIFVPANILNQIMGPTSSLYRGIFAGESFDCSEVYQENKVLCAITHINVGSLILLSVFAICAVSICYGLYFIISHVICYNPANGQIEDREWWTRCCNLCGNIFWGVDCCPPQPELENRVAPLIQNESEQIGEVKIDIHGKEPGLLAPGGPRKYSSPECIICGKLSDDLANSNPFPIAQPCGHQVICTKCVVENHKKYSTCSICRAPIDNFVYN